MLTKNKREAKLITIHMNPVSTRTVLVLFCFYILNIGITLGEEVACCCKGLETNCLEINQLHSFLTPSTLAGVVGRKMTPSKDVRP